MTLRAAPITRPRRPGRAPVRLQAPLVRPASKTRRLSGRTAVALIALTVVTTAAAPAVITIQPGDTLWGLAREHDTTVAELQRLNGLGGSGTIYAGRTLKVPGSGGGAVSGGRTHVVRSGETVSHLAVRYGVTTRDIVAANGLASSGLIRIGQRLSIPGGSAPAASPASTQTHNAGVRIPDRVLQSVAHHRAVLASRPRVSKAQVREIVAATARRYGVDPSLALAVAYHESGFQQHVVSPVDAIGVMQVLPSTGRGVSRLVGRDLDLLDVHDNITAGVALLDQLLTSTGSTDKALAGYYQGLGSVAKRGLLPQTHAYIRNINALRPRFGG
ncbi:MAG: LysM peptidoglycan-binding domain-containing protein [Actinomycetes bacterium]